MQPGGIEIAAWPQMPTREPKLEKDERTSSEVTEPTVMAFGVKAGEYEPASALLSPAATTTITPALTAPSTACLKACRVPAPPKLKLATTGCIELVANQSDPV